MKRILFLTLALCAFSFGVRAQEDVFSDGVEKTSIVKLNRTDKVNIKTSAEKYRNPDIALTFSIFMPGAGQFYNGQDAKGLAFFLGTYACFGVSYISVLTGLLTWTTHYNGTPYGPSYRGNVGNVSLLAMGGVSLLAGIGLWIYSAVDAYNIAGKINLQKGFFRLDLGKDKQMSFSPNLVYDNDNKLSLGARINFSF